MKIGYARVSTEYQSLEMQIEALEKAGCERIYKDTYTGSKMSRPDFDRMIEALREDDELHVYKLDRLGRDTKGMLEFITEMEKRKVSIKSLTESFDTSSALGKAMIQVMLVFAEMERNIISERTKSALDVKRKHGIVGGRPEVENSKVKTALTLYDSKNYTIKEICKEVGIGKATLYKYLHMREGKSNADAPQSKKHHLHSKDVC